jgi:large-conductance mechanosensitive channel
VNGDNSYLHPKLYHPIIGLILLGLIFLQPFYELANHLFYDKYAKIANLGYVHVWLGRLLLLLGIVNGGLGFAFSDQLPGNTWSNAPRIAYGVIATVVVFVYIAVCVVWQQVRVVRKMSEFSNRVREEEMQGLRPQRMEDVKAEPSTEPETRPQTAQTAITESTVTDKNFRSTAL